MGLINTLPGPQKEVARQAFAESLSSMWILYTVVAAVGLGVSVGIKRNDLSRKHEETRTGMEAERERRVERERAREERRRGRGKEVGGGEGRGGRAGGGERDVEKVG